MSEIEASLFMALCLPGVCVNKHINIYDMKQAWYMHAALMILIVLYVTMGERKINFAIL